MRGLDWLYLYLRDLHFIAKTLLGGVEKYADLNTRPETHNVPLDCVLFALLFQFTNIRTEGCILLLPSSVPVD